VTLRFNVPEAVAVGRAFCRQPRRIREAPRGEVRRRLPCRRRAAAIGARRKPASRSIAFGGRRTHQSGNLKLKCRSCRKGRYAPPVHMIRLTEERQTVPYVWVHPDEDATGTYELCAVGCVRYEDGNGRTRETAFFRTNRGGEGFEASKNKEEEYED
jgi:hypothetical protein